MTTYDVAGLEDAFWAKADRGDGCWVWRGARNVNGYGGFNVNRRQRLAHRVAWTLVRGEIPPGLCVLHRCDNPPCVNPDHLFLGTQDDNNADRDAKGRVARGDRSGGRRHPESYRGIKRPPEQIPRGEANGASLLTAEAVVEIRRLYSNGGVSFASLAVRFGVKQTTIFKVIHRRTWRHIP